MLKHTRIGALVLISFLSLLFVIPAAQQAAAQSASWVKVPGAANSNSIGADGTV